jgi:hypothetical protein
VAADIEQERKNLIQHWDKQLERAKYEVERAYRQYNTAEPENRLVARTLEKKWEEALSEEERLKRAHAKFIIEQPPTLSLEEREAIQQLSSDIPALWSESTTTVQERQEIIRLLIEKIIVTVEGNSEKVQVEIHWAGGHKASIPFVRPIAKLENLSYYHELLDRAAYLREEGKEFRVIANVLNQEGWRPPKCQKDFKAGMIGSLLLRRGVDSAKKMRVSAVNRQPNELTLRELSQKTNLPESTLFTYLKKGMLSARRTQESNGLWLVTADEQEIKRLQDLKNRPPEWLYRLRAKKVN